MIFISCSWSSNMLLKDHYLVDFRKNIGKEVFDKYSEGAYSHINKPNVAKILNLEYNARPIQLRPGDVLLEVHIIGGKLQPYEEELPDDVDFEFNCYTVYSPNTHGITENEKILMEE